MDPNLFKCKCCGASLKPSHTVFGEYTCEYCGNRYRIENNDVIRVETFQNPIATICVKKMISQEAVKIIGEAASEQMIMENMAREISSELLRYVCLEKEYDPISMMHSFKGRIRVVKEDYRF